MTEDAVDIDVHLFLREVFDQLHVAVSDCVHEGIPIVWRVEFVDQVGEGIEKIDDLLCIALLWVKSTVPIQQKILVT